MAAPFSYADAFDRNLGWFTEKEQQSLRGKTIAIAGMGGVGGVHLLTLVRLGVTKFHIADLDVFEVANFNRQVCILAPHIRLEPLFQSVSLPCNKRDHSNIPLD